MPNDYYRAFWLDGSFDRPERPEIWSQTSPHCDGRWCASGLGHRGSSLQWYIVPRAACHICEPKRPVSRNPAGKDYYGRSGADLHLNCDLAREALGPAIIRHQEEWRVAHRRIRSGRKPLLAPSSEIDAATRLSVLINVRITSALRLGARTLGFLKAGKSRTTVYGCKIVIVANHYDLPFRNDCLL